jgi:hypoxia up-regulated 1
LGKFYDDPIAQEYRNTYSNGMFKNASRNSIAFNVDKSAFSLEELVAMQLKHAKDQAEIYGQENVYGAVITVLYSLITIGSSLL